MAAAAIEGVTLTGTKQNPAKHFRTPAQDDGPAEFLLNDANSKFSFSARGEKNNLLKEIARAAIERSSLY
jgi:hypothetical protein